MTAFFDSAKAIISRFDTQWAAAHPSFPITHDNQHYEPAEGVDFIYISVQFGPNPTRTLLANSS
jgi:hypothetical protein